MITNTREHGSVCVCVVFGSLITFVELDFYFCHEKGTTTRRAGGQMLNYKRCLSSGIRLVGHYANDCCHGSQWWAVVAVVGSGKLNSGGKINFFVTMWSRMLKPTKFSVLITVVNVRKFV